MRSEFYDFIKYDPKIKSRHYDFSGGNESFDVHERVEFLKEYSKFLACKNGRESVKVVGNEEADSLAKSIGDQPLPAVRKRTPLRGVRAYLKKNLSDYAGWNFYGNAFVSEGEVIFNDGDIPPVSCAKYEFSGEKIREAELSFFIAKEYLSDAAEEGKVKEPLVTDTGRIIEIRSGIKELVKLQIYDNGRIYARIGKPDFYHHRNECIGTYKTDEYNRLKIVFGENDYSVTLNESSKIAHVPFTHDPENGEFADNVFFSGGMRPAAEWRIRPEKTVYADGNEKTDFFVKEENVSYQEEFIGVVDLPYAVGTADNADKALILKSEYDYEGGRAVLYCGALDPCGEVFVNGIKATERENFLSFSADITRLLKRGENEIKIIVYPRAPEVLYSWHRNRDPYVGWFSREAYIDILPESYIKDFTLATTGFAEGKAIIHAEAELDSFDKAEKQREIKLFVKKIFPNVEAEKEILSVRTSGNKMSEVVSVKADKWSPDNPNLYEVRAVLRENGEDIDDVVTETGFRTIEQKRGEILLNGEKTELFGALIMQFLPPCDKIVINHVCPSDGEIAAEMLALKKMNGNTARMHVLGYGTNDPRFARICDRLGIMLIWTTRLIDSLETVKKEGGWKQAEAYFSQAKELFNYPSIIMWEGSNEFHSDRETLDEMFDCFVKTLKPLNDGRILCPSSHIYYGGGLYGNEGFYYQDDGKRNQNFEPCKSSFGWKDESVIRSTHNYEILLGYGNSWEKFRKQSWKSQPALLKSKKHAYIISEFAVIGRQDDTTPECKEYVKTDSYELADEKRVFGDAITQKEWRLSQAYQALCAYNSVKYMRYLGADGLMWCCLSGGANDGSYLKPPIDFYGYAKQAFYALKESFKKTICFNRKTDVACGEKYFIEPCIVGTKSGKTYLVEIFVCDTKGNRTMVKKYENVAGEDGKTDLEKFAFPVKELGYYAIQYVTVEEGRK